MTSCNFLHNVSASTDSCCQQHDADYSHGSKVSRLEADRKLLACLLKNGNARWKVYPAYILVRLFGWIFYKG